MNESELADEVRKCVGRLNELAREAADMNVLVRVDSTLERDTGSALLRREYQAIISKRI